MLNVKGNAETRDTLKIYNLYCRRFKKNAFDIKGLLKLINCCFKDFSVAGFGSHCIGSTH